MTNVTQIATVATGVIQLIEVGKDIYEATTKAMDAVEAQGTLKGEDKKLWVLSFIKSLVDGSGLDWQDWVTLISNFIDKIKEMYNTIKHLLK